MESEYQTIRLSINDYISPECSCKIEDMVNTIEHVVDTTFDPVNNLLAVKVHKGMVTAKDIIGVLKRCSVRCEEREPAHEMAHMPLHFSSFLISHNCGASTECKALFSVIDHEPMT